MRLHTSLLTALVLFSSSPALAFGFGSGTLLSPQQEVLGSAVPFTVAPVAFESQGIARARVDFDRRFSSVQVLVRFARLDGAVTRLHFHCAPPGENGPIALGLIDQVDSNNDNSDVVTLDPDNGTISGRLTLADFPATDPCVGRIGRSVNNLAALAQAIEEGLIYLNLHTDVWPAGELRGQGPF